MDKKTRFNCSDADGMTQPEIAAVLGVKRQVVSKIERRALKKLEVLLRERGYSAADFFDDATLDDS